ncbi:MAG: NAD(P)(+) transhydrogenase (Re/Si-specific) subunit beta, partial [Thermoanaerobaculia bacterium]
MIPHLVQFCYLIATGLFVLALKWLSHPTTARRGVLAGVFGMTAAITGTLLFPEIVEYRWIVVALIVGTVIGVPLSRVPLTAVPQRTALALAFGGTAVGLVGTAKYILWLHQPGELTTFRTVAIAIEVLLGFLTLTGALMAAGKLQEVIPTRPVTYRNQNLVTFLLLGIAIFSVVMLVRDPTQW